MKILKKKQEKENLKEDGKQKVMKKHTSKQLDLTNMKDVIVLSLSVGFAIIIANLLFFSRNAQTFAILNLFAGVIIIGLPLTLSYRRRENIKRVEIMFPIFLRDINENINVGMTLPQSIRETTNNSYGPLTKYVKEISAKIDWGIDLDTILQNFAKQMKSPLINRTVRAINETHKSGGDVGKVLESISASMESAENIKKERSASIYSQMINGYFIFFIFLGVMLTLSRFLFPALQLNVGEASGLKQVYDELFMSLIVIEGIFSGLAIGKMAEGRFIAGFKHSVSLTVIGYVSYIIFAL
ncbi:MAG: type II secretion system F family protein [Candidatus Aenigmatarchaeota archaeon]